MVPIDFNFRGGGGGDPHTTMRRGGGACSQDNRGGDMQIDSFQICTTAVQRNLLFSGPLCGRWPVLINIQSIHMGLKRVKEQGTEWWLGLGAELTKWLAKVLHFVPDEVVIRFLKGKNK